MTTTLSPRTRSFLASGRGITDIDRKPDLMLEIRSQVIADAAADAAMYFTIAASYEGREMTPDVIAEMLATLRPYAEAYTDYLSATREAAVYYRKLRNMAGEDVARELAALYSEQAGF